MRAVVCFAGQVRVFDRGHQTGMPKDRLYLLEIDPRLNQMGCIAVTQAV